MRAERVPRPKTATKERGGQGTTAGTLGTCPRSGECEGNYAVALTTQPGSGAPNFEMR